MSIGNALSTYLNSAKYVQDWSVNCRLILSNEVEIQICDEIVKLLIFMNFRKKSEHANVIYGGP